MHTTHAISQILLLILCNKKRCGVCVCLFFFCRNSNDAKFFIRAVDIGHSTPVTHSIKHATQNQIYSYRFGEAKRLKRGTQKYFLFFVSKNETKENNEIFRCCNHFFRRSNCDGSRKPVNVVILVKDGKLIKSTQQKYFD